MMSYLVGRLLAWDASVEAQAMGTKRIATKRRNGGARRQLSRVDCQRAIYFE
jgi:hypothetical protein